MKRREAGFSLLEMILATGLASIVLLGMSSILFSLVRAQAVAAKSQSVQVNLAAAVKTADHEISQASWIGLPSQAGVPDQRLAGCVNASPPMDDAPSQPLDPSQAMRWFAFCSADGVLYYHSGPGCPPAYACGVAAAASFAAGEQSQTVATFTRAPLTTVVDVAVTMTNGEASGTLTSAASFAAAAGSGQ